MTNGFIKVPKYLFSKPYNELSNNAKLLYILMLDKLSMSKANDWLDSEDNYFIICSREYMMKDLNIGSKSTIAKIMHELTSSGLIVEQYFAIGSPNRILFNIIE